MNDYAKFVITPQDNPRDEALRIFGAVIPLALLALLIIGGLAYAALT
jgi:hypothetical protein